MRLISRYLCASKWLVIFIPLQLNKYFYMHIPCTRHLGLKIDQATVVTLENKVVHVFRAQQWCFWGMWLCPRLLITRPECDQSDHSCCVLVIELWVHMYFPRCWFARWGRYLFSTLWMAVKIYAPESEAWRVPCQGPETTFCCHTSSCCNHLGSVPGAGCVTQWQLQSERGLGDKEALDQEITVTMVS